ncbi:MAG: hypothetical protein AB8B55_12060, partial [Mariniblastus sp.]
MILRKIILQAICFLIVLSIPFVQSANAAQDDTKPATRMTPKLLWELGRLGEAVISTDGTQVAYIVRRYELEKDKGASELHLLSIATGDDKLVLEKWPSIGSLHWMPTESGELLFFEGTKAALETGEDDKAEDAEEPTNQAYSMDPKTAKVVQLTDVEDGIANLKVSNGGKKLAFTLDIKMDQEPNELYPDLPKADARIIDQLMYRHWNAWHDYKYSHLHVASIGPDGVAGTPIDLMEGL